MKPWEGKHWLEAVKTISLIRDLDLKDVKGSEGIAWGANAIIQAAKKDWEEQNKDCPPIESQNCDHASIEKYLLSEKQFLRGLLDMWGTPK